MSYSKIPAGKKQHEPPRKKFYNDIKTKECKAKQLVSALEKINSAWLPFARKVLDDPAIPAPDLAIDYLLTSTAPTYFHWQTESGVRVSAGFNFLTDTIDVYCSTNEAGSQHMAAVEEAYQAVRAVFVPPK